MAEGSDQNLNDIGMNVQPAIDEVARFVASLGTIVEANKRAAQSFFSFGSAADDSLVRLQKIDEVGNSLTETFAKVDGVVTRTSRSISLVDTESRRAVESQETLKNKIVKAFADEANAQADLKDKIVKAFADEGNARAALQAKIVKAFADEEVAIEKLRIKKEADKAKEINDQEALKNKIVQAFADEGNAQAALQSKIVKAFADIEARELQDHAARMARYEAERRARLNQQLNLGQTLRTSNQQGQNQFAGEQFGQNLFSQQAARRPDDAQYLTRISSAINQITAQITKGNVEAARAQQIVNSVLSGQTALFSGEEGKVAAAAGRINSAFKSTEDAAERAREGITLSWTTMGRILSTQLLHNLIRAFTNELQEAIHTSLEFQQRISEIRTISQAAGVSFNQWADAARHLSGEFGNPLLDVTEGIYETISNQIAKGTEATQFMTKALEFARTTHSTTAQSVNLLSSAINSFGLSAGDAEHVAAVFFKTIDLGRVRAEDLANTFGKVGPLGRTLGITMEEIGAAIATLTINGVPAQETLTLLENLMKGLITPTKGMKELFRDLNVETGQQAISTYSLVGFMSQLDQRTQGASNEIADLLHNIRGLRGAIGLTGQFSAQFSQNFDQITNSLSQYRAAVGISFESSASQLQIQLQKIRNYVEVDFAEPFIRSAVNVSNALSDGGLSGVFKNLVSLVGTGTEVFLAYKVATYGSAAASQIQVKWTVAQTAATTAQANAINLLVESEQIQANIERERAISTELSTSAMSKATLATLARAEAEALFQASYAESQLATDIEIGAILQSKELTVAEEQEAKAHLANAVALKAEAEEKVRLIETNEFLSQSELREAEAATIRAEAQLANVASLHAEAAEQAAVTAGRLRLNALGSSIVGFATNPVVLGTVAVVGIIKLIGYWLDLEYQMDHAYETAAKAEELALSKMTEDVNKQLATQTRLFNDHLGQVFASYTSLGSQVERELQKITQSEIDQLETVSEITRKQIDTYIKDYDDQTRQIEAVAKKSQDNLIKALEQADRQKENYANKEFQRQLQLAEHIDRLTLTKLGSGIKLFDENQLKLVTDEFNRLLSLSQKSFDPKTSNETNTKNLDRADELGTSLLTRRQKLEEDQAKNLEEAKKAHDKIEQEDAAFKARQSQNELQDQARTVAGANARNKVPGALRGQANEIAEEQEKKAHEDRVAALKKEEDVILAQGQAFKKSLELLPSMVDLQNKLKEIEQTRTNNLEIYLETQNEIAANAEKEVDDRKKAFETLRVTLLELSKIRFDKSFDSKEKIDDVTTKFDEQLAKASGLHVSDDLYAQLLRQREQLQIASNKKLQELQIKTDIEELARKKSDIETARAASEAAIKTNNDKLKKLLTDEQQGTSLRGIFGTNNDDKIGEINQTLLQGHGINADNTQLAAKLNELDASVKHLVESGTAVPESLIREFEATEKAYKEAVLNSFGPGGREAVLEIPTKTNRKDQQGNPLPDITLGQEFDRADRAIVELRKLNAEALKNQAKINEQNEQTKILDKRADELKQAVTKVTGPLDAVSGGFSELVSRTNDIVTQFTNLRDTLNKLSATQGPPNPIQSAPSSPALGPQAHAVGGQVFGGPPGTDTVPAWLNNGEFVVNKQATDMFLPQLKAINSGNYGATLRIPQADTRSLGVGSGNSYQFGAIQVHISGGQNVNYDAKQLAVAIQNEVRRTGINLERNKHD